MSKSKNKIHGKSTFLKERQSRPEGGIIQAECLLNLLWLCSYICELSPGQLREDRAGCKYVIGCNALHGSVHIIRY